VVIGADELDLPAVPDDSAVASESHELPAAWLDAELPAAVEKLEREMIAHALEVCKGNRAEVARRLGIHRQLLYRKLAQYGLA
jgi:two-component system NtrC family response regulator